MINVCNTSRTTFFAIMLSVVLNSVVAKADEEPTVPSAKAGDEVKEKQPTPDKDGWIPLFNGKDLTGWTITNYGGEGAVEVEKGTIVLEPGVDLSGINSTRKDWPKMNYEIEFEAQRSSGSDFFVGLTFPVRDSHCSLICGGWGGGVFGISSLDGMDASENETTGYMNFTNGQWYKVRLKVTPERIEGWLDKAQIVDVEMTGQKIDVRFEMDLSKPLGFATYQSEARIRKARLRKIPAPAKAKKATKAQPAATTGSEAGSTNATK